MYTSECFRPGRRKLLRRVPAHVFPSGTTTRGRTAPKNTFSELLHPGHRLLRPTTPPGGGGGGRSWGAPGCSSPRFKSPLAGAEVPPSPHLLRSLRESNELTRGLGFCHGKMSKKAGEEAETSGFITDTWRVPSGFLKSGRGSLVPAAKRGQTLSGSYRCTK